MPSIGVGNRVVSGEEFAAALNKGETPAVVAVTGAAKKSDADASQVLFCPGGQSGVWVKIPTAMIDSAEVLGQVVGGGQRQPFVRLYLKPPSHPETAVLADLLGHSEALRTRRSPFALGASDGTLPLHASDSTLPLHASDGTLPLHASDGTLPLFLLGAWYSLLRWGVGDG